MQIGLIVANQNKKLESGHFTFWKCYIQGAPRKKQCTAPSVEHLKFPENMTFAEVFWVKLDKKKKK